MKQTKKLRFAICVFISLLIMCFSTFGAFSNDLQTEELLTEATDISKANLITQSSVNNPGSYTALWDNMVDYQGVERSTNDSIWLCAGGWAEFHVPVTEEGIYYLQMKSTGGSTTLRVEADSAYYSQLPVSENEQFYKLNSDGNYEFIYFTPGEHSVILRNIGSVDCRVIDLEFKASQYAVDDGVTPSRADCKPFSELNLSAHTHVHGINTTQSGEDQTSVFGTDWYSSADEFQVHNEVSFVMEKGDWAKYEVVVPYTGIYQLDTRLGASSSAGHTDSQITFYSQDGYKVSYPALMANGWEGSWQEGCYIYLEEGSNIITAINTGDDALALYTILLTELEDNGADFADLLITNANDGIYVDGLTIENQTAKVYVFKMGDSYDVSKLVLAEYDENLQMMQVEVLTLPLDEQAIFTGAEYEISLDNQVVGTMKAFVATENLIPYTGAVTN